MRSLYILALGCISIAASPAVFAADADYLLRPSYDATTSDLGSYSPWTRPYIGVFGGVAPADFGYSVSDPTGVLGTANITGGGFEGGLRIGYDYATDGFLIGTLADFSLSAIRASVNASTNVFGGIAVGSIESRIDNLTTLRLRAGTLPQRNLAVYAHGGLALGNVSISANGAKIPDIIDKTRVGYAIGIGTEYAVHENISFNTEYSYVNLGKVDVYTNAGVTTSEDIAAHRVNAGLNFRF
jgi:outer membrane immunogenic protein